LASANGHLEMVKYLLEMGCDHNEVKKEIKYEALQYCKVKLLTLTHTIPDCIYLKVKILKIAFPCFSEWEIMNVCNSVSLVGNDKIMRQEK